MENYGIIDFVLTLISLFSVIVIFGQDYAVARFFNQENITNKKISYFTIFNNTPYSNNFIFTINIFNNIFIKKKFVSGK